MSISAVSRGDSSTRLCSSSQTLTLVMVSGIQPPRTIAPSPDTGHSTDSASMRPRIERFIMSVIVVARSGPSKRTRNSAIASPANNTRPRPAATSHRRNRIAGRASTPA